MQKFEDGSSNFRWSPGGKPPESFQPNPVLAAYLLCGRRLARQRSVPLPADLGAALNPGQRAAADAALASRVFFLWGGPSTGKTTTLGAIVAALYRDRRRVLVAAPTNAAADVMALRLAEQLSFDPAFGAGAMLRAGRGVATSLRTRWGSWVVPALVSARIAGERGRRPAQDVEATRAKLLRLCAAADGLDRLAPGVMDPALRTSFVALLRALRVRLAAAICHDAQVGRRGTVAVVSPYRAQVSLISGKIPGRATAATVHAQQGSEFDVMVIDLTDAPGLPVGPFLSAQSLEDAGARLLNVAVSRARETVVVVAEFGYLERFGGRVVRQLLRSLRHQGTPWLG